MSSQEGDKAFAEAEKKLKGNVLGFGKDPDAAIDCFKRACNNYKVSGCYVEAARCQTRIAEVAEKQQDAYELASACMEASKLLIKAGDLTGAIASLQKAKQLYIQNGKVNQAARACKELASAVKDGNKDQQVLALHTYLEAARLYDSDSQYTEMHKMKVEAAILMTKHGQYKGAAELFEAVANEYVKNNLLKYGARDHYMNAILCHMADNDTSKALNKRDEYQIADVQFQGSRHETLVSNCLNAMLANNADEFATAVAEWENMTKLEPFRVDLLLAAKKCLSGAPDVLDDDDDDLDLT